MVIRSPENGQCRPHSAHTKPLELAKIPVNPEATNHQRIQVSENSLRSLSPHCLQFVKNL